MVVQEKGKLPLSWGWGWIGDQWLKTAQSKRYLFLLNKIEDAWEDENDQEFERLRGEIAKLGIHLLFVRDPSTGRTWSLAKSC